MKKSLLFIHNDSMTQNDYEFMSAHPGYFPGVGFLNKNCISFKNMFATAPVTEMVLPSIFSGILPLSDGGYEYGLNNRKINLFSELEKEKYQVYLISGAQNYSSLYGFAKEKFKTIPTWSVELSWRAFQKVYLLHLFRSVDEGMINEKYIQDVLLRHYNFFISAIKQDNHFYTKYVFLLNNKKKEKIINKIKKDIEEIKNNLLDYLKKNKKKLLNNSFCTFFYKTSICEKLLSIFEKMVWSGKTSEFPNFKIPFTNIYIETPLKQTTADEVFLILSNIVKENSNLPNVIIVSIYDIHNRNYSSQKIIKFWKSRDKEFEEKYKNYFNDPRRLYCLKYFDENLFNFLSNKKNLLDNYVIVLTSDHGAVFKDDESAMNCSTLTGSFHDVYLKIPFIIYNKKYKSKNIDSLSSSVDIFPTLLDTLDINSSGIKLDGNNKIKGTKFKNYIISEHAHRGACSLNLSKGIAYISLRTKDYKYIKKLKSHEGDFNKKIMEILVDVNDDKNEIINLVNDEKYSEILTYFRQQYLYRIKELNLLKYSD